jgi:hypothetical protein
MGSRGSLITVSYISDRPTTRPKRPSFLEQIKSHIGIVTTIGTFGATLVTGGWTLYDHISTDPELMDHNMSSTAHPAMLHDLEERVAALESGFKKTEAGYVPIREDLIYVAERYVSIVAAENEPDRRIKMRTAGEAVQEFRRMIRKGSSVQDAVYEATHRR